MSVEYPGLPKAADLVRSSEKTVCYWWEMHLRSKSSMHVWAVESLWRVTGKEVEKESVVVREAVVSRDGYTFVSTGKAVLLTNFDAEPQMCILPYNVLQLELYMFPDILVLYLAECAPVIKRSSEKWVLSRRFPEHWAAIAGPPLGGSCPHLHSDHSATGQGQLRRVCPPGSPVVAMERERGNDVGGGRPCFISAKLSLRCLGLSNTGWSGVAMTASEVLSN